MCVYIHTVLRAFLGQSVVSVMWKEKFSVSVAHLHSSEQQVPPACSFLLLHQSLLKQLEIIRVIREAVSPVDECWGKR